MITLFLSVEVSGCPTSCLHCWARDHAYHPMPLSYIARVLEQSRRFCDANGFTFDTYPMHEVLNHPQASEILEICVSHAPNMGIDPIPTDGVSLALREDWQSLLETMKSLGTTTVWFTLHGLNAVALTAGIVTEEEVQRWRTSLEQADSNHTFFGSVTQVMVAGCKP